MPETITKPKIDYDSSVNQRIKSKLVDREVVCCVSTMVNELPKQAEYVEDLLEVSISDDWETAAKESEQWQELSKGTQLGIYIAKSFSEFCGKNNIDPYRIEALEHWVVTDHFADKLEERGEMVLRHFLGFNAIWGRATSGQAIMLDGVVSDIAEGMEILEGQPNDWSLSEKQEEARRKQYENEDGYDNQETCPKCGIDKSADLHEHLADMEGETNYYKCSECETCWTWSWKCAGYVREIDGDVAEHLNQ